MKEGILDEKKQHMKGTEELKENLEKRSQCLERKVLRGEQSIIKGFLSETCHHHIRSSEEDKITWLPNSGENLLPYSQ